MIDRVFVILYVDRHDGNVTVLGLSETLEEAKCFVDKNNYEAQSYGDFIEIRRITDGDADDYYYGYSGEVVAKCVVANKHMNTPAEWRMAEAAE